MNKFAALFFILLITTGCTNINIGETSSSIVSSTLISTSDGYEDLHYYYTGGDESWCGEFWADIFVKSKSDDNTLSFPAYSHNYKLTVSYNGNADDLKSFKAISIRYVAGTESKGQILTYENNIEDFSFTIESNQLDGAIVYEDTIIKVFISLDDGKEHVFDLINPNIQ